jgi:hypothetical protein
MEMKKVLMALVVMTAMIGAAAADTQWSQVGWLTAESVAHSISYGIYNATLACSQTALFYVEPAPIDGTQTKINATMDEAGEYACQTDSQGAFKVNNDGSVGINVTIVFSQITTGVSPKVATADAGWQATCDGTCTHEGCDLSSKCILLSTSPEQVIYNLAQNSSKEMWLWADFNGVAGTAAPTKGNMTTEATKA